MATRRIDWLAPVLTGITLALILGWGLRGAGAGLGELLAAFLLGAFLRRNPFRIGFLLILPLVVPVIVISAQSSLIVTLFSAMALTFLGVLNGLVAIVGTFVNGDWRTSPVD